MEPITAQMPDATVVGLYIVSFICLVAILAFDPIKNHID